MVDGDRSLVCTDHTLIKVAERNKEKKDVVPLFYNMRKAGAEIINKQSIYKGLKTAYTGGNIGIISNNISKIWNSDNINIDAIKLLCLENNFTIDFAKTLYKPERPKDKKGMITDYTKLKVPHFFIYAKDKSIKEVEPINNSTVNRLSCIIPNPKINFKAVGLDNFDYKMLMSSKNIDLKYTDEDIIKKYRELDLKNRFMTVCSVDDDSSNDGLYIYKDIRNQILEVNDDIKYVIDVLVDYLYRYKNSNYKTTLWSSFGDVLIDNLKNNIEIKNTYCQNCGELIEKTINNKKYCEKCAKEIIKKRDRERKRKNSTSEKP